MHLRGWSPVGALEQSKLSKDEAHNLQKTIGDALDDPTRACINWSAPFMRKHSMSSEVFECGAMCTKRICDNTNPTIAARKLLMRNNAIRAAAETSPTRRPMSKSSFVDKDKMADPGAKWLTCSRALYISDSMQCRNLGFLHKDIDRWVWDKDAPKASRLKDPEEDRIATDEGQNQEEEKKENRAAEGAVEPQRPQPERQPEEHRERSGATVALLNIDAPCPLCTRGEIRWLVDHRPILVVWVIMQLRSFALEHRAHVTCVGRHSTCCDACRRYLSHLSYVGCRPPFPYLVSV